MPTAWAGGNIVCIPGLGTGRIICEGPRVIEISLPAAECAVFLVNDPHGGPRAVVLTDPRVPWEHTVRAIAVARHLEDSAVDPASIELPAVAGEATPPAGIPVITARPDLQLVRGSG